MKALKNFQITGRLILIVGINVKAESYEDAVAESKTLREADFVKIKGEFCDGSLSVVSIAKDPIWDTEQD